MATQYPNLLKPGRIGNLEIANRVSFAPIGSANNTKDGHVTQYTLDYYDKLVAGVAV